MDSAQGWRVFSNEIRGMRCSMAAEAVGMRFSRGCRDINIERNRVINAEMGFRLGVYASPLQTTNPRRYADNPCSSTSSYYDFTGGIVRNNLIYSDDPLIIVDTGIAAWQACGTSIVHNTVYFPQTPLVSAIEWRFDGTRLDVISNLVRGPLKARSNTAVTPLHSPQVSANWFVDVASGDFHLSDTATGAIDKARRLAAGGTSSRLLPLRLESSRGYGGTSPSAIRLKNVRRSHDSPKGPSASWVVCDSRMRLDAPIRSAAFVNLSKSSEPGLVVSFTSSAQRSLAPTNTRSISRLSLVRKKYVSTRWSYTASVPMICSMTNPSQLAPTHGC